MELDQFNIPPDLIRDYGEQVLREVTTQIHPVGDCYRCQKQLGTQGRFSLVANGDDPLAIFYPAHAPCAASSVPDATYTTVLPATYQVLAAVMPPDGRAVVFANPSVDRVDVWRRNGKWNVGGAHDLEALGWVRVQRNTNFTVPRLAVINRESSGQWVLDGGGAEKWEIPGDTPPQFDDRVRHVGSVYVLANAKIPVGSIHSAMNSNPAQALQLATSFMYDKDTVTCAAHLKGWTWAAHKGAAFGL